LKEKTTLGISAPQVGINQRFFIVPRDFNFLLYQNSPAMMRAKTRAL
jgi:peptide deformylase